MALTYGQGVAASNGNFSLTLVGDGSSSEIVVDLSQPPFSMSLGTLVPQAAIVTAFGSRGGTMALNPSAPEQVAITVAAGPSGNAMSAGQQVQVSGFLTFNGITPTPPTVVSISPATGGTAGGTLVTITGTGFTGATSVKFGGQAVTSFKVVSDTEITTDAPEGAVGMVDVTVTTPFGTTAVIAGDEFTYA
jgi:hypothetical protein